MGFTPYERKPQAVRAGVDQKRKGEQQRKGNFGVLRETRSSWRALKIIMENSHEMNEAGEIDKPRKLIPTPLKFDHKFELSSVFGRCSHKTPTRTTYPANLNPGNKGISATCLAALSFLAAILGGNSRLKPPSIIPQKDHIIA